MLQTVSVQELKGCFHHQTVEVDLSNFSAGDSTEIRLLDLSQCSLKRTTKSGRLCLWRPNSGDVC